MTATAQEKPLGTIGTRATARPLGTRLYRFLRSIPTWLLWLLVSVWTVPTLGLFINSFRTRNAQRNAGWWLFWQDGANGYGGLTLDSYQEVLRAGQTGGIGTALLNSAAIAVVSTLIPIAVAAFAAYAFAWMEFRGREWLFIATVALLAIPAQTSLIPLLQMYAGGAPPDDPDRRQDAHSVPGS
jgi:alpha-glucoside transport system permease protein